MNRVFDYSESTACYEINPSAIEVANWEDHNGRLGRCILTMVLLFTGVPLMAQTIVFAGYEPPVYGQAMPGQVITLYVRGLHPRIARATSLPLPTVLDGVSVEISDPGPTRVPVFSISPAGPTPYLCTTGQLCQTTAVTVQIPFELSTGGPPLAEPPPFTLTVIDGSVRGTPFGFVQFPAIHILKVHACSALNSASCSAVAHQDGSLVTESRPARPGETLVMYAAGLGRTIPAVPSGTAAPVPAPVTIGRYSLGFDFTPAPVTCGPRLPGTAEPHFVGLTPGFVGLYQVNFTLPAEIPPYTPSCRGLPGRTNLTITLAIVGPTDLQLPKGALDAACICVAQ